MRRGLLVLASVVLLAGCGHEAEPRLAHGRPLDEWVRDLHAPDARLRHKAVEVLGNIGAGEAAVVPALTEALKDRDAAIRNEAVLALMKRGAAAESALPALTEALRDANPRVRANAAKACEAIRHRSGS